ncbi:hypothetical protein ACLBOM_25180 [Escherichia coli]
MDNGAHFDGDQSGTVNGVTPPAVQHLTAEVTADSGGSRCWRAGTRRRW